MSGFRVVIDRQVDRDAAEHAAHWINEQASCELLWVEPGHGTRRDWAALRAFPPRGTVTMEVNPSRAHSRLEPHRVAVAISSWRHARGRIFLDRWAMDKSSVIAHELLHQLGLGHKCGTVMSGKDCSNRPGLVLDQDQVGKLMEVCDGD